MKFSKITSHNSPMTDYYLTDWHFCKYCNQHILFWFLVGYTWAKLDQNCLIEFFKFFNLLMAINTNITIKYICTTINIRSPKYGLHKTKYWKRSMLLNCTALHRRQATNKHHYKTKSSHGLPITYHLSFHSEYWKS